MSFLESLSESLCFELLAEWIKIEDLVKLDTALTNKVNRLSIQQLYEQDYFVIYGKLEYPFKETMEIGSS